MISSPYFIPDAEFRGLLRALVARGVRVVVVTNSLETNNHVVAHTGYRRWRREVLAAGVELYELRSDAEALSLYVTPPATPRISACTRRPSFVDRERAFVGSPNVDPRSMVLNTEIGVVGDGPEFAARVAALISATSRPRMLGASRWTRKVGSVVERRRGRASATGRKAFSAAIEFLLNLLPLKNQA